MAIHPINLVPGQLQVPKVDTSWLANLYTNYQGSQLNQAKLDEVERRQGALAELGKLNPNDPNYAQQVAQIALRMGDISGGLSAINNAAELKLKREELEAKRSAPTLGGALPSSTPPTAPAPGPLPSLSPSLATPPSSATPQVAPGVPGLGAQPGDVPVLGRTPTSASLQPQTTQTPPIMAQSGAPGSNFTGYSAAPDKSTVRFGGVSSELLQHANEVGNSLHGTLNRPLYVTSARDSTHTTGSQHYVGNALDLRTRDLSAPQRQAIVASFRARGLTAVDEGDHIHVAMPRGAAPQPGAPGAPGTVLASAQGRGPVSYGAGGAAVASAVPQTPLARTTVAALDPSFAPQTSMTDAGPQLPAGVSPAAPAAQGAAGPPILPSPTPLVPPNISLAALGALPPGGVGTIGPMGGPAVDAMPPQGVQVAQAAQGGQGAYQPPFQLPAIQAPPVYPPRPPVQQAPAVAPTAAPGVARGPVSGSPLEHIPKERLLAVATHRYASDGDRQLAIAELNRRATVAADANKTSTDYNDYLAELRAGTFKGTRLEYEQAKKADVTLKRLYQGVVEDRARRGLPPEPEGGFEQFVKDNKAGTNLTIDQRQQDAEQKGKQERFNTRVEHAMAAGTNAFELQRNVGALRELGVKTGAKAAITGWLAERGVKLEGAGEIEAYGAIIDRMTPAQRIPGAGATSDFDAKLFKSGLPSVIRSGLGNEIILNTYEKLAKNHEARGELANSYDAGDIDKATFMKELNKLGKEAYQIGVDAVRDARATEAKRSEPGGGARLADPPPGTDPAAWAEILKAYPGLAGGKK